MGSLLRNRQLNVLVCDKWFHRYLLRKFALIQLSNTIFEAVMVDFKGFSPELFRFLTELKQNNNRAWFEENKPRY